MIYIGPTSHKRSMIYIGQTSHKNIYWTDEYIDTDESQEKHDRRVTRET